MTPKVLYVLYYVVLFFMIAVFKHNLIIEAEVIDLEVDSADDFSIMCTHLPNTAKQDEIKNFFQDKFPNVQVVDVSMGYDVDHLLKMIEQKEKLQTEIINLVRKTSNGR